jgi:hypothetical protein
MNQEPKRFEVHILRKTKDQTGTSRLWVEGGHAVSSTPGETIAKFALMLDAPGDYIKQNNEVLAYFVSCDGKRLISIPMIHKDKTIVLWNVVDFHSHDRDLLKAMMAAFPEQQAILKQRALDDALGL